MRSTPSGFVVATAAVLALALVACGHVGPQEDAGRSDVRATEGGGADAGPDAPLPDAGESGTDAATDAPPDGPPMVCGPDAGPCWTPIDLSSTSGVPGQAISGLVTAVRVDPRNADVVYVATTGGGVWKTTSFTTRPAWTSLTDAMPRQDVGAVELDPTAPDTVYAGLSSEYGSQYTPPAYVVRSDDGGAHWQPPVALVSVAFANSRIHAIVVDPNNTAVVLVATNDGLFRSTDRGAHFARVAVAGTNPVAWSLAYVGRVGTGGTFVLSGIVGGAAGDLYRSGDDGATWSSGRAGHTLPLPAGGIRRITLAVGHVTDPGHTVVYAMADVGTPGVTGFFRSTDGGVHYAQFAGNATAAGTTDCPTVADVGGFQVGYNQAIAVDPTNDNHVALGGQLCAMRTLDGLAAAPSFNRVAHWLGIGLPFVHADWHAALISNVGGTVRMLAGCDGGLFDSTNVFSVAAGAESTIVFRNDNAGLATHLSQTVGSADPSRHAHDGVLTGMQDNGSITGQLGAPSSFASVLGGDGTATAINQGTGGEFYWARISNRFFCRRSAGTCLTPGEWHQVDPPLPAGDVDGDGDGNVRYAPVWTDATGATFIGNSDYNVFHTDGTPRWVSITGTHCLGAGGCVGGNFPQRINQVVVSTAVPGLYGLVLRNNFFAVTSTGTAAAPRWTIAPTAVGSASPAFAFDGQSLALPASTPTGTMPGDFYVVASGYPFGTGPRIYATHNRGTTFAPLSPSGTDVGLPAAGVMVLRYDPSDASNRTLYAGTQLGVYRTTDAGAHWSRFGVGLPNVVVRDLFIARDGSLVRIATYGRGLWEISPRGP